MTPGWSDDDARQAHVGPPTSPDALRALETLRSSIERTLVDLDRYLADLAHATDGPAGDRDAAAGSRGGPRSPRQ